MSRRTVTIGQPFTGGMRPDLPTFALGPTETPVAQDLIVRNLFAQQRYGWEYDGSTADEAAKNNLTVWRNKFSLVGATRTFVTNSDGDLYLHNAAASGTALSTTAFLSDHLPRCVYKDQVVYCSQSANVPAVFCSGDASTARTDTGTWTWTANQANATGTAGTVLSGAAAKGQYFLAEFVGSSTMVVIYPRITEATSTSNLTIEDVKASATTNFVAGAVQTYNVGLSWPCVATYSEGTITSAADAVTGVGTKFSTGFTFHGTDAILTLPASGSAAYEGSIQGAPGSETTWTAYLPDIATGTRYTVASRCPFIDAASHRGSLWGIGTTQHKNRVFISPLGWNPAFPPGFTAPFDPSVQPTSTNPNDFLLDFIDVPTPDHGDQNVAVLSAPDSLLVLKRNSYYRITGQHPNVDWVEGEQGKGCIDIRSAWNIDGTPFWAGENGIYAYWQGYAYDLTAGRINREWRQLVQGGVSYCSLGVTHGYLVVHVTNAQATQRTYVYRLPAPGARPDSGWWDSRTTNLNPRYMHSARISGEVERLLVVHDDDQGRIIDASPVFSGKKTNSSTDFSAAATDADPRDDDGTSPSFEARTGTGLFGGNGIDGETVVYDMAISHNVYDTGAANASNLDVSWVYSGGLQEAAGETTLTLADIQSDSTDLIDRTDFPDINASGRLHQLRLDQNTTATTHKKTEIAQVVVEVEHLDPGT